MTELLSAARKVALLDRDVAERIAAGEVIERPVSVVKELFENAIDAGSTRIRVDLQNGGLDSIRITDDGCGMSKEDLTLAVQRFATSKISRWEDLDALNTFGFRGEALPSVGAVSQLDISTRASDADWGWRLLMRGGCLVKLEETGCKVGTQIVVTELFYNTPARKKFLKAPVSEAARVHELVGALSLTIPHVQVALKHNGKDLLDLPASPTSVPVHETVLVRLRKLWGIKAEQGFLPVDLCDEDGQVQGWISTPDLMWPNRRKLLLFVNRRLVTAPALCHAVSDGVGAGRGRYPMGVLDVLVAGDEVDVNVHPTKAEVRFQDADQVYRRVRHSVVRACQTDAGRASMPGWQPPPPNADWRNAALEPFAAWPDARPASDTGPLLTLVPLRGGLVLAVRDGALWIVDPHVVQERRLRQAIELGESTGLVFPLMMEVLGRDAERLQRGVPALETLGFVLERFGTTTFLVRRVPVGCERLVDDQRLYRVLSNALSTGEDWLQRFVREAACEAVPQTADMQALVSGLTDEDWDPARGAHGRAGAALVPADTLLKWLETGCLPG